jgi:exonuclease III
MCGLGPSPLMTHLNCSHAIGYEVRDTVTVQSIRSVVVWNINGIRKRWNADAGGLEQLLRDEVPDVVIVLEAKASWRSLLKTKGFVDFVHQAGYRHTYCYWSQRPNMVTHGQCGIWVMSRVTPLRVTCGLSGDVDGDHEARAITMEFHEHIVVGTYNPQGGFEQASLTQKERWEGRLALHLAELAQTRKHIVWSGTSM